ncbi:MAG: AAA family ATPase [Kofleriaceae bacterium]
MRVRFQCHVIRHVSGRVTVTPLDQPDLAVHAHDVEAATEEVTLALDDRISRAHPRRVFELTRSPPGAPLELPLPLIIVHEEESDATEEAMVYAVSAPAHRPYQEVRAPRLDARLWLSGKQVADQAQALLAAGIEDLEEQRRLELRPEGPEEWLELAFDVEPMRLSDLKRSELSLDERKPRVPRADGVDSEDDERETTHPLDEDWDDTRKRRKHRTGAKAAPRDKRPATPTLAKLGIAWHALALEGALPPAYERDALVADLLARVSVELPEPMVLVGPAGAGKTAILQELARRLVAPELGKPKADRAPRPVWFLDSSRLVAGDGSFGGWQAQVLEVIREARAAKAVLILGNLLDLLDAGKTAHSDQNVAQLLAPVLAARELTVLAEATADQWAQVGSRQQTLARTFSVLHVDDPSPQTVATVLARVGEDLGRELQLTVEPAAVREVQALCQRFVPYGALVGNAVAMLRRLVDKRAKELTPAVDAAAALALFSSESGIPRALLDDAEPLEEATVRAFLAERVRGQERAVARAAQVISVIKANLADRGRPTAVLLFAGPTGVGKTELAKAMAELVFGSRTRMIRLDLGEYAGPDALARLVGDGAQPGHLSRAVRRQPFSVVLLDEVEKAHPAVFDVLLGVLGEGRLTDAAGAFVDFRSTVVIMTSNLGAETAKPRAGFGAAAAPTDLTAHYRAEAQRFFRPELFNRLDDLVVFDSLGEATLLGIAQRELARVVTRDGFRRREVQVLIADEVRARLARRGFDPRYGARPLKRVIERELVAPIAEYLAGHPAKGALQLEVLERDDAIALAATSVGGEQEGVSRKAIEDVLNEASALRAEVRQWTASTPMRRLTEHLALFDRSSRHPSFWVDRTLADEQSRGAAEGRELSAAFTSAQRAAEAAEDLAYEAYYARQVAAAASLRDELAQVRAGLRPLVERLFASLFPPRNTVGLVLTTSRTGWPHLCELCEAIEDWVKARGGTITTHMPEDLEPEAPAASGRSKAGRAAAAKTTDPRRAEAAEQVAAKAKRKAKAKKGAPKSYRWKRDTPNARAPADLFTVLLFASSARGLMLLSGEHGVHRFSDGGTTATVHVRFEARLSAPPTLDAAFVEDLEKRKPTEEIRRIWPSKGTVQDVRLGKTFDLEHRQVKLEPILDAWMRYRLLSPLVALGDES